MEDVEGKGRFKTFLIMFPDSGSICYGQRPDSNPAIQLRTERKQKDWNDVLLLGRPSSQLSSSVLLPTQISGKLKRPFQDTEGKSKMGPASSPEGSLNTIQDTNWQRKPM